MNHDDFIINGVFFHLESGIYKEYMCVDKATTLIIAIPVAPQQKGYTEYAADFKTPVKQGSYTVPWEEIKLNPKNYQMVTFGESEWANCRLYVEQPDNGQVYLHTASALKGKTISPEDKADYAIPLGVNVATSAPQYLTTKEVADKFHKAGEEFNKAMGDWTALISQLEFDHTLLDLTEDPEPAPVNTTAVTQTLDIVDESTYFPLTNPDDDYFEKNAETLLKDERCWLNEVAQAREGTKQPKKRGRPPGSKNKPKNTPNPDKPEPGDSYLGDQNFA